MFLSILRRIAPLAIAVAALTACSSDAPLAPHAVAAARVTTLKPTSSLNQMYRDAATVPFSFGVYASCANAGQGEVLDATGELEYRGHWSTSSDGQRTHHALVQRFTGTAIGWDTGETYDVATRELSQGNINDGSDGILDSGEELQRVQLHLTSRSTGTIIDIVLTSHFVETPTGEFVLGGWEAKARCR